MAFPGDDGGHSLAALAQRDLDATLQLLADRALYITGSTGAAIALRRGGKNDMQCRASIGANAPELGALLSTEFGISGESVRSRQALRCDDAERDPRVNREGCRQLGIASVVVMPVVHDDEVLGVFELFSGKANAFGERDLSALQRLSEMVETAVRLAQAAEGLPERLLNLDVAAPMVQAEAAPADDDHILEDPVVEVETEIAVEAAAATAEPAAETIAVTEMAPVVEQGIVMEPAALVDPPAGLPAIAEAAPSASVVEHIGPPAEAAIAEPTEAAAAKKPLFWSAAMIANEGQKPAEADRSHVPPVLRNLKTCQACGFPVSPGRMLCVECEEKKWRGQLRARQGGALPPSGIPKPLRAFAAAPSGAAAAPAASANSPSEPAKREMSVAKSLDAKAQSVAAPAFVLSAGLQPSQSWISRNKYILGAIVVVAAAVAAILFLR